MDQTYHTPTLDPQEAVALTPTRPPITRLNRRVVIAASLIVTMLIAIAFMIGLSASKRSNTPMEEPISPYRAKAPETLSMLPATYGDLPPPPEVAPAGFPTLPRTQAASVAGDTRDPLRLSAANPHPSYSAIDATMLKEAEEARLSGLFFGAHATFDPDKSDPGSVNPPGAAGREIAAENTQRLVLEDVPPLPRSVRQNLQTEKQQFLTSTRDTASYLQQPYLRPVSDYEIKAGSVIPAALVTAINTDLPGDITARVTENVYDSVTGRYLLIPQGAVLYGTYDSLISNGQNRALVVWNRLIMPNGRSIVLENMPGADKLGQAGLSDKVDYHLDKLALSVALSTAIAYGGNLARDNSSSRGDEADIVGATVSQEASRIGQRVVDRQLDVQPTITIRSGWPLRVLVNKDIVLAPYRAVGAGPPDGPLDQR